MILIVIKNSDNNNLICFINNIKLTQTTDNKQPYGELTKDQKLPCCFLIVPLKDKTRAY